MSLDAGLEAVAAELDAALRRVGVDLRSDARLVARPQRQGEQHGVTSA